MICPKLAKRLRNWGEWCNYDAEIGPPHDRCRSLESKALADTGDVWDEAPEVHVVPDITDAEAMDVLIRNLHCAERWALAIRYAGSGAVIRWRRIGEHALEKLANNAEILLSDMVREKA